MNEAIKIKLKLLDGTEAERTFFKLYPPYEEKIFVYVWLKENNDDTFTPMYVGKTTNGVRRWRKERKIKECKALYNGIQYHKNKLKPFVICFCDRENLSELEYHWFNILKTSTLYNGYNIRVPLLNTVVIPEYILKIQSMLNDGKDCFDIISLYPYMSLEAIRSINRGNRWFNPKYKYPLNSLPAQISYIGHYDKEGNLLEVYGSISQASRTTKTSRGAIRNMVTKTYGFFRKYEKAEKVCDNIGEINYEIKSYIIAQYDINGKLVCVYSSLKAASKAIGKENSWGREHIKQCLSTGKGIICYGGFLWRNYEKEEDVPKTIIPIKPKTGKNGGKTVYCYDDKGSLVNIFQNCHRAADFLGNPGCYSQIAEKARMKSKKMYKGFYWSYTKYEE